MFANHLFKAAVAGVFAICAVSCSGNGNNSDSSGSDRNPDAAQSAIETKSVNSVDSFTNSVVKKPTVIDFYADWCGPCRQIAPLFEELESEYDEKVEFKRVNVDVDEQLAAQYDVVSIPTFVFLDADGNLINKVVGADAESLKANVKKLYDSNL